MWKKDYSARVRGVTAEDVWRVWTDVNQWHTWQDDIEYAKIEGEFKAGNTFLLKPKGGPKITIEIVEAEPRRIFVDLTRFPGAKMYGCHEFRVDGDVLEIKTGVSIEGPLSFIWRKLVGEGISHGMKEQTDGLIQRATAKKPAV